MLTLEATTLYRLFGAARRGGANRRMALRAAFGRLVPDQVRRIVGFDLQGMVSLALWVARRRLAEPDLSYAAFNRRYRERARSGALRFRAPAPLREADIWRAYQIELRERGEPHHDPWGFNPFERS
ncbi:hypothetical protein ABZ297_46755 [Nonomuraea sp. NPDC005983]|uniref:hypothetical protein n=1 Tax=Nonomuraea sp. NPDC005983 TaxID=3155595 RepID=UPI0033AD2C93